MIHLRLAGDRGFADHGWLKSHHTFSFADYHDPEHMGFSVLRVINQDRIAARAGFPKHGHRDMEIVSYVLSGVLEHEDSMGNGSQMRPGEVQLMSAGTGVTHSEFNAADDELEFLQMWVLPRAAGTAPRYEQKDFAGERCGGLRLVVSPDGADGSLTIGQDVRMYASSLAPGQSAELALPDARVAWLHLARGGVTLNGEALAAGDGAAICGEPTLSIAADSESSELVLFDLPEIRDGAL